MDEFVSIGVSMTTRKPMTGDEDLIIRARRLRQAGRGRDALALLRYTQNQMRSRRMSTLPWVQIQLAVLSRYAGQYSRTAQLLSAAQVSANRSGNHVAELWVAAQSLELDRVKGNFSNVAKFCELANDMRAANDFAGVAWCLNAAAQSLLNRGVPSLARTLFSESYESARSGDDGAEAGWASRGIAESSLRIGSIGDADKWIRIAQLHFESLGYSNGLAYVDRTIASIQISQGESALALETCMTGLRRTGLEKRTRGYLHMTASRAASQIGAGEASLATGVHASQLFRQIGVSPPNRQGLFLPPTS